MRIRTVVTGAAGLAVVAVLSGTAPASAGPAPVAPAGHGGWRVAAAIPAGAGRAELTRVVATGPADAWAAGVRCTSPCARGRLVVDHWNGKRWRPVQ